MLPTRDVPLRLLPGMDFLQSQVVARIRRVAFEHHEIGSQVTPKLPRNNWG
jgi:hypothetical protein